jgi:hypothetical protein
LCLPSCCLAMVICVTIFCDILKIIIHIQCLRNDIFTLPLKLYRNENTIFLKHPIHNIHCSSFRYRSILQEVTIRPWNCVSISLLQSLSYRVLSISIVSDICKQCKSFTRFVIGERLQASKCRMQCSLPVSFNSNGNNGMDVWFVTDY